jgi:hypothetical protein
MLNRIIRVTAMEGHRLNIEFADGVSGTIDLSGRLTGEMFEPLRDEAIFSQVAIDDFGAVYWPNGADFAPDAMYAEVVASNVEIRVAGK